MTPPPRVPAESGWRRRLLPAVALATLVLGVACAVLPPREALLPPAGAAPARVTLLGANGPVADGVQEKDLARVQAEGRAALLEHHLKVLAAQGNGDLYRGNTARLLVDGPQTFAAMKAAIAGAHQQVLLEFYIVEDDGVAAEIAELLLKKAAEGVNVALLYDSVGSIDTDSAFFQRLREGGVLVCAFNPVNPLQRPGRWALVERNHRKMLAVDGQVAYTGGINLSDVYSRSSSGRGGSGGSSGGSAPPDAGWRDTQIELRGPVVAGMVQPLRQAWAEQACSGTLAPPLPPARAPGQRVVRLVAGDPGQGVNPTYTTLLAGTDAARRSVRLTMAYFAPGPDLVQALCDAARRGVAVELVLPGRSDVSLLQHAARSYYAQLLAAGVQVHEMQHTVMHAKTAVIDGVLSSIGSSNLDWRSIVGNHEIDVIVLGDDFGQQMEDLFQRDVARSRRIDPAQWQQRGAGQRLLEALGRALEPLL